MNNLDKKITETFEGCVVRKDLVKEVKGNAIVPSYVLEYLLGQYCASSDEDVIKSGIESVKEILAKHYVNRNEAEYIKSTIKEKGRYKVIDKVSVQFNEKTDSYIATFSNLGITGINVPSEIAYKKYPRLLVSGIWCLADLEYQYTEDKKACPWLLQNIKPIQLAQFDFEDFKAKRAMFSTDEWIDLLMQSIGFNPEMLSRRKKLLQLVRLIPYCERNYNFIELRPKGTGKSHIYTEFSPHGTLISGGEVSAAKLFVNNSRKHDIGLVGYWDNIAFDEFAGNEILAPRDVQDYHSMYQDIHDEFEKRRKVEAVDITEDIEFEMELIKTIDINIDYILNLVKKYHESNMEDKELLLKINKAILASPELRNKKDLIDQFIDSLNQDSDVYKDFETFMNSKKKEELDKIIEDEGLKDEETYEFIRKSFDRGSIEENGTDVVNILPQMSRFSVDNDRAKKKQRVLDKLIEFFDKFFSITGK